VYAALALAAVLVAGCSRADPGHAAAAAESWAATAKLAGEAWLTGAVPRYYARRVLALSAQRLGEASSELGPAGDRARGAAAAVTRLRAAIEAGQGRAARDALAAIPGERAR
jgi:hypothetical protein